MNKNNIIFRLEKKEEYREVENLVRESFWNVYRPGCLEHYVLNQLRDDPAFVPELDFVMEQDGKIIGQNMFMRANINADDGRDIAIMAMGPICITPELKRKGYGKNQRRLKKKSKIWKNSGYNGHSTSRRLCIKKTNGRRKYVFNDFK